MVKREMSNTEIKADIMNRLLRKSYWGAKYLPFSSVVNWLSKQVKNNGKRVRACIEELAREGYVLFHKKGEAISLNPIKSKEIIEFIKSVIP